MYLDNSSIEEASGVYPIDDDDYASASGSGKAGSSVSASVLHAYTCTCRRTHTLLEPISRRQAGCTVVKDTPWESKCLDASSSSPPLEL